MELKGKKGERRREETVRLGGWVGRNESQTSVEAPSATALLQHGIQFLLLLKIVLPYTVSSATSSLTS